MKHTAYLVTAGDGSGARFGAPFLLPALRFAASACCEAVRTVTPGELETCLRERHENEALLLLDARMPLIAPEDCGRLVRAVELGASVAVAEGAERAEGALPRCVGKGDAAPVSVPVSDDARRIIETPADIAEALCVLRPRTNAALLAKGVLLIDPDHTYIDPDVRVGAGTVIHPGVTLSGGTVIGAGCTLLPGSRLHAARVGEDTTIESSVLLECEVGAHTTVGPFAYLRPHTRVGDGCRVGDFVEIKNSVIGDGTKVSHLTYVGDSDLGRHINLGCGVVFVNYDGLRKHRSTVEDGAFIGCNVNLVSPVHVGEGAYVAAGSTVTDDVPGGALAIARARQTTKDGWATKRRMEGNLWRMDDHL